MTALSRPAVQQLCAALRIAAPIVSAPVAPSPRLVAAVSEAGGLGMLPLSWVAPAEVAPLVRETRALTAAPFGVNLVLQWDPRERLRAALDEGVDVVSFFWGDPAPHVTAVHAAGALVTATVGSAEEGRRVAAAGVDVVVAQGVEAGGHVWGGVGTFALVPAVVDAVAPVPVLAAGGIADARGLAAAICLGAGGAWLGTRFVASAEAPFHPAYKEAVVVAAETDTVLSQLFDGGWPDAPHRALRNSTVRAWEAAGRPASGARPGEGEEVARTPDGRPLRRYEDAVAEEGVTGEPEALALYAGQGAGLVRDIAAVATIVSELVTGAARILG